MLVCNCSHSQVQILTVLLLYLCVCPCRSFKDWKRDDHLPIASLLSLHHCVKQVVCTLYAGLQWAERRLVVQSASSAKLHWQHPGGPGEQHHGGWDGQPARWCWHWRGMLHCHSPKSSPISQCRNAFLTVSRRFWVQMSSVGMTTLNWHFGIGKSCLFISIWNRLFVSVANW